MPGEGGRGLEGPPNSLPWRLCKESWRFRVEWTGTENEVKGDVHTPKPVTTHVFHQRRGWWLQQPTFTQFHESPRSSAHPLCELQEHPLSEGSQLRRMRAQRLSRSRVQPAAELSDSGAWITPCASSPPPPLAHNPAPNKRGCQNMT